MAVLTAHQHQGSIERRLEVGGGGSQGLPWFSERYVYTRFQKSPKTVVRKTKKSRSEFTSAPGGEVEAGDLPRDLDAQEDRAVPQGTSWLSKEKLAVLALQAVRASSSSALLVYITIHLGSFGGVGRVWLARETLSRVGKVGLGRTSPTQETGPPFEVRWLLFEALAAFMIFVLASVCVYIYICIYIYM